MGKVKIILTNIHETLEEMLRDKEIAECVEDVEVTEYGKNEYGYYVTKHIS